MSSETIYGIHAVASYLHKSPQDCIELICQQRSSVRLRDLISQARTAGVKVREIPRSELDEICGSDRHQGCVLMVWADKTPVNLPNLLEAVGQKTLFLVLDGIQDPHNLGACLRTADAAGVDAVIVPKQRAAKLTASVRKVAAGAAETVPLIEVINIVRFLEQLKQAGVWVYGACGNSGESIYQQDFNAAVALVMGGEGDGLRRLTREHCDHLISLPMLGQVESLNVSVATGICLYEIQRARGACRRA